MKWNFITIALILFICNTTLSQNNIGKLTGCKLFENDTSEAIWTFNPNKTAEEIISKILSTATIDINFTFLPSNIPSSLATINENIRLLLFNEVNINKLSWYTVEGLCDYIKLFHAISHHSLQHELNKNGYFSDESEMAADSLAGSIMLIYTYDIDSVMLSKSISCAFNGVKNNKKHENMFLIGWKTARKNINRDTLRIPKYYSSTSDSIDFPFFPWPPPEASAFVRVPLYLDTLSSSNTFGTVAAKLEDALNNSGYSEKSYYRVPNGFALVTRIEQINNDGTSKSGPQRWNTTLKNNVFTLSDYIKALFKAPVGRFRIICFVFTDLPFSQTIVQTSIDSANAWLKNGFDAIPVSIAQLPINKQFKCTALIYEFEKANTRSNASFISPSLLNGLDHLHAAQIWNKLSK